MVTGFSSKKQKNVPGAGENMHGDEMVLYGDNCDVIMGAHKPKWALSVGYSSVNGRWRLPVKKKPNAKFIARVVARQSASTGVNRKV